MGRQAQEAEMAQEPADSDLVRTLPFLFAFPQLHRKEAQPIGSILSAFLSIVSKHSLTPDNWHFGLKPGTAMLRGFIEKLIFRTWL